MSASRERQAGRPALVSTRALLNVLLWCAIVTLGVFAWVLWGLDGIGYYTTPLAERAYHHAHLALKPTGYVAHVLGATGVLLILMPVAYSVRKKWKRLSRWGSLKTW